MTNDEIVAKIIKLNRAGQLTFECDEAKELEKVLTELESEVPVCCTSVSIRLDVTLSDVEMTGYDPGDSNAYDGFKVTWHGRPLRIDDMEVLDWIEE